MKPYLTTIRYSNILKNLLVHSKVTSHPTSENTHCFGKDETQNTPWFSRKMLWVFAKINFLSYIKF